VLSYVVKCSMYALDNDMTVLQHPMLQ
jgi:hypothetical protein